MSKYYDGTKLLSLLDINKCKPEIYICATNRTAGKTIFFNRMLINHVLKKKTKFLLLYRYGYELENIPDSFFKDIGKLFFQKYKFTSVKKRKGVYYELYLNDTRCGYATAINYSEQIKKISHLFSDVDEILFDEFQSSNNKYIKNEVGQFYSIHTSVARGNGMQSRHVPVYMLGNSVSLLNPYYTTLGISSILNDETKFLRGNGYVLERTVNKSAQQAQLNSSFNQAFKSSASFAHEAENSYLNDNYSFIEKVNGKSRYVATLVYNSKKFAIREFDRKGIIYVDKKVDYSNPTTLCLTTEDFNINYIMLKNNSILISSLRKMFEFGCFRFKDLECKDAILKMLSY